MRGTGSVFLRKSDGRWLAQISVGPRGARRQISRSAGSRAEAKRRLVELLEDVASTRNPQTWTLGAYLRHWLDSAAVDLRPNTVRGYEDAIAHLEPIAGIALRALTPEDIEAALATMTNRRGSTARPSSPKT